MNPLDDLDDEIRDHLERETRDNIDRGMAPDAARAAARRKFGNVAMTKEDVGQGMMIAAVGCGIGVAAALVATRTMTSLLYDVTPTDPLTFAVVIAGLALTVLAACSGPALMAARVDPALALRSE